MDIMKDGRSSSIWILNADGSNHQKLTSSTRNESNPRWSPDSKKISFISSSDDDNGSEIFIYWVDSKQYSSISQLSGSPRSIKWSRNGKYLGFSMFVPEKTLQLVSPPRKPKNAKWAEKPRITERLKHEADGSGYMREGFTHLFYISSNGGSPTQVTSKKYNHRSFEWNANSKGFIFSSNYKEDWEYDFRNSELYSINLDGTGLKQLTDRKGPDYGAVISPDGNLIAYLGYDDKIQTRGTASGTLIGVARARTIEYNTGTAGETTSVYKLFMFDIQPFTKLTLSGTPSPTLLSIHSDGGVQVKGVTSGATGFIFADGTTGESVNLTNVVGSFSTGEKITTSDSATL